MTATTITARFWGVRGSIPVSGPEMVQGGGNTACVELRCGPHIIVFDAGTGLKGVGQAFDAEGVRSFDLFLSHCHYDHIIGLPFFKPLYRDGVKVKMWSGHLGGQMSTQEVVDGLMRWPYLPMGIDAFAASISYGDFSAGDVLRPRPGIVMRTAPLHHPGGATGYRLEYKGKTMAYVTDTEHDPGEFDRDVLALIDGADLVIYDCAFTDEELPRFKGYGHSTWQQGIRLCRKAKAAKLAIYHHSPFRTDEELAAIEGQARAEFGGAFVARDGMVVTI